MLSDDDRELLRLAAIACGELHGEWVGNDAYFDGVLSRWNPLTDDGDALRLAVRLNLFNGAEFYHFRSLERFGRQDEDDLAATRRAIVRAAAEIGRQHD